MTTGPPGGRLRGRAAAIAYRVLFPLVPFVALLVSVLDLDVRTRIVSWLFGVRPGAEIEVSADRAQRLRLA